ncbi:MAG: DUF433 domain-containing protein [Gammaproteobacteria bacterium]
MSQLDRIVIDPTIRFGKPTIRGTRLCAVERTDHFGLRQGSG